MSLITPIAKYDLNKQQFSFIVKESQRIYAYSTVRRSYIFDENNDHYDFIILANGNRVKDVSRDGSHPYQERDYTQKMINYFRTKKKNVIVEHLLVDKDAPLDVDSKLFADYIDLLASQEDIDTINLIGHSKCGNVFFNMPKYFKKEKSFEKCSLVTTASPFLGCLIASPKIFLPEVQQLIDAKLPSPLSGVVYRSLENYYNSIASYSHMDNDIALPGYVSDKYDPEFIKGMFDIANINAVKRLRYYYNFITGIDDKSLIRSLKRRDFTSVGLCLMDKYLMQELTDGFIEVRSQESANQYFDSASSRVPGATHFFLSHDDELAIILDYIDQRIDEYKEEKGVKKLSKEAPSWTSTI